MVITEKVNKALLTILPLAPPESGGLLGGKNGIVDRVVIDRASSHEACYKYCPDVSTLNSVLQQWAQENITFYGMFHTHPAQKGYERLSGMDVDYIRQILQCAKAGEKTLYFPIIMPQVKIIPYSANMTDGVLTIEKTNLIVLSRRQNYDDEQGKH